MTNSQQNTRIADENTTKSCVRLTVKEDRLASVAISS